MTGTFDGRLVVVTNREPFRVVEREGEKRVERTAGGVISALEPAMRASDGLWISGDPHAIAEDEQVRAFLEDLPWEWRPAPYDESLADDFYLGFSNGALWPLFHSLLGDTQYHRHHFAAYRAVNARFADAVHAALKPGDFVWVHDYQLCMLPAGLRDRGLPVDAKIGFFLHIPFPPYDLFRTLPWGRHVLEGMLGASLIGFHIPEYAHNFMDCIEQLLGLYCDRHRMRVKVGERFVQVGAFPIGIDPQPIYDALDDDGVQERAAALRRQVGAKYLVCGVDRLDYTKGLVQRVRAVETFFERYPHRQGEVSVVQVAVPSREEIDAYQDIRVELEQRSGHINGLMARPGWTPFTLMCRSLPFEELVALYSASDVAMVTPIRDGMNLVAKEFVAAHHERGGALVLSELAGAAQQLTEAVLVNPYHVDEIADALERALSLEETVQRRRMKKMNAKVRNTDVAWWVEAFLGEALYVD